MISEDDEKRVPGAPDGFGIGMKDDGTITIVTEEEYRKLIAKRDAEEAAELKKAQVEKSYDLRARE